MAPKRNAPCSPSSGRGGSGCASSNHCFTKDIHYLGAESESTSKRRRLSTSVVTPATRSSPRKEPGATRLLTRESKVEIFRAMYKYKTEGGKSPVGRLVKEFGVNRATPMRILRKVLEKGSVDNTWNIKGRPTEYTEDVWEAMVEIVREHREEKQERAPAKKIRSVLISRFDDETCPSVRTIQRKKAAMKYKIVKVEIKPWLSTKDMEVRFVYAARWSKASWRRVVHIDEKWFTEEKPKKRSVEVRPESPNKAPFATHKKETQTQLNKLMYLAAVCEKGAVGIWLLDWSDYIKKNKDGSLRRGKVDSDFMRPFWKKIHDSAVKVLGPGPITLVVDRAPSHVSKSSKAAISKYFKELVIQPPRSPDFNLLDASVFPSLERLCNASGAVTHAQIKDAVKAIWKQVTPSEMERAVEKVKRNMKASADITNGRGGDFYKE